MSVHQVITGALNRGENVFAVGSVEGINFTVCAVGSDVVILSPTFERVQVIPGSDHDKEEIVGSVNCCADSGKIAATYGHVVRIFEPTHHAGEKSKHRLDYRWFETQSITAAGPISSVLWNLEGLRLLLVSGNELLLYQHRSLSNGQALNSLDTPAQVMFSIAEEDHHDAGASAPSHSSWELVWRMELATEPKYVRFSPDGSLLATAGENDRCVKIWYNDMDVPEGGALAFNYVSLLHPVGVLGFEWRKTGRYMPRKCIQNVLLTWCQDNTARVWKESPPPDQLLIDISGEGGEIPPSDRLSKKNFVQKHFKVKRTRNKIMSKLKHLIPEKKRRVEDNAMGLRAQFTKTPSYSEFSAVFATAHLMQFNLAASINAENDCLLVPSMESGSRLQQPFTVHWLNNKELLFSIGAEKLLAEALINESQNQIDPLRKSASESPCDGEEERGGSVSSPPPPSTSAELSTQPTSSVCSDAPSAKDILDVKLEMLLRQWTKSTDILFTVHPVDGSLLTWTIEWLDDLYRQPSVSFTSRLPNAFPLTDASCLHSNLCTFNPHDPVYVDVLQRHSASQSEPSAAVPERVLEKRKTNMVFLLTSHENGSLNLWHLSMDEASNFTTILNITHRSRMCGHRFQISKVVAHPVLPLLLTTSQFSPRGDTVRVEDNRCLSEVILWKIDPVGPLCKSGGVRELSRITSPSPVAFTNVAWIPAILPSCTLGTVCNSPSSCFVASDGRSLVVYQAVVDARGLLAEIYNARRAATPSSFHEDLLDASPAKKSTVIVDTFNVISTQSTAKPGCVLLIGKIGDALPEKGSTLLLHVFNESLISDTSATGRVSPILDREFAFSDKYFVVAVEKTDDGDRFIMYSVGLSSQLPMPIPNYSSDREDSKADPNTAFLRPASPVVPSAAKLSLTSELVCDQLLSLPKGVRVVSAVPAAGHLPSASLYPACKAPYVLVTSCSDDIVRFWCCVNTPTGFSWQEWKMIGGDSRGSAQDVDGVICSVSAAHSGRFACAYDSGAERYGRPSLNCRAQVEVGVFECESSGGVEWLREDTLHVSHIELRLPRPDDYVCSELRSPVDEIVADVNRQPTQRNGTLLTRISSKPNLGLTAVNSTHDLKRAVSTHTLKAQSTYATMDLRDMVSLDWVSAEDGSHVLTVGVAANIYLYTQVSQDMAQQNVTMMKETETHLRRPSLRKGSSLVSPEFAVNRLTKWICVRVLELQSADGLPPIPTTLTWARDGLLIVGMQSEMRCYSQWNLKSIIQKSNTPPPPPPKAVASTLSISPSHSMLDQLAKKSKETSSTSNRNRLMLDIVNRALNNNHPQQHYKEETVLEVISDEGLFEAARLASPMLPQYHPKQLIVLLNGGKTRRVKAILLHVLRSLKRNVSMPNPLARAASIRRMSTVDMDASANGTDSGDAPKMPIGLEEPEYDEIDDIAPLPLHALFAADVQQNTEKGERAADLHSSNEENKDPSSYDGLFEAKMEEEDLDEVLAWDADSTGGRSRHASGGSDVIAARSSEVPILFTAKHNRMLTELLTHTHLPGLSSVDQMHLLAIADTLSHFSADVMDKLTQANAAMQQPTLPSVVSEASSGYATASVGIETVDECGLRFLMAMKQHEYLLLCLPPKQRAALRSRGLANAHVIWALHSDTETELLNALPALHKEKPMWEELRALGIAWWLKNPASLRVCVEKLAKAAFQQNQEPMDASLYYLAMRKKNVLTHLFKTIRDQRMSDFFQNDFNEPLWQKAAAKNAFVLMSKQRFTHAAAFFLLSGSLKDALQTIIHKLHDLQLAMVVLRLYETDLERQSTMFREILCREVLGMSPENFESLRPCDEDTPLTISSSPDPFERSMAFWLLKDYRRAAQTLVVEATQGRLGGQVALSDIFNFYSFLRKHPLVIRQRLTDAGIQMGSTEKFLAVARQLEATVTPEERRLYFRTAAEHQAHGCPMLALDVLSRLPKSMFLNVTEGNILAQENGESKKDERTEDVDWGAPTTIESDELELKWSDGEDEEEEEGKSMDITITKPPEEQKLTLAQNSQGDSNQIVDIISQHLKFVASMRIMTEELSTLASGFEVDGGQLRYQLFHWLEKEVDVLKNICDYQVPEDDIPGPPLPEESFAEAETVNSSMTALHEALKVDRLELSAKIRNATRKRRWLVAHQKLLRSFTSFCALHSAQNHRLTSALMELLLLLLEVQKDTGNIHLSEPLPDVHSFPLLVASVSSTKMFVSSPLAFIENQCYDLLLSIAEITDSPGFDSRLTRVYVLYNLCQGLSACLYQSLSDVDTFSAPSFIHQSSGVLTRRARSFSSAVDDIRVTTPPSKWPGVESLLALLNREKDEESPHLRLLLAECFVAISMFVSPCLSITFRSLFSFALAAYDARWLFRMAAHHVDAKQFASIFGGGGEKKLRVAPVRPPPRPAAPRPRPSDSSSNDGSVTIDSASSVNFRSKLNAKVFGATSAKAAKVAASPAVSETTVLRWVPPNKNIVQMYAEKPPIRVKEDLGVDYDSDESEDEEEEDAELEVPNEQERADSFAWTLMRLALVEQQSFRLKEFLALAGFDTADIPSLAPRVEAVLRLLESWGGELREQLTSWAGGPPADLLPQSSLDLTDAHLGPQLRKYRVLLEPKNTPFESDSKQSAPVRRLWAFLVHQEHLTPTFIRHIFATKGQQEVPSEKIDTVAGAGHSLPEAYKIIQREHEPIVAFACSQEQPGWLVISTGRELQEMDISGIFEESQKSQSWLNNRSELDVALSLAKKDPLKDNDDYQLLNDNAVTRTTTNPPLTPFIVDRSRRALRKMFKRTISGIRRIDSHPTAPFYVTGSGDGSIRVWEWGVGQPLYTARVAGQHGKVTKLAFSANGNKFAAVDGDGMLCLWQAVQSSEHKKPFFSQKAHSKSAADVRFIGHTSSLLLTAGYGSGDQNLALWDTLLPHSKACIQTWTAHPEGATCALYLAAQQTIVSGGRHGEICLWDVRQRSLRHTVKAFESSQVRALVTDHSQDILVAGSGDGDIKIWSAEVQPQLMFSLPGEHVARGGFSLRQVAGSSAGAQGVQQLYVDANTRLFSCGADCSLKVRSIPSVFNLI